LDKVVRQHEKSRAVTAKEKGGRGKTDRDIKGLKEALALLHKEVKVSEGYYKHVHWLQERFPDAEYEDVTGLCKLATQEEVKEQDYSLNPGRYVGVVIEEDGRTEEEFIEKLFSSHDQLIGLSSDAKKIEKVIATNVAILVEEE